MQQKQIRAICPLHCKERASFLRVMKINASRKSQGHHLWCRETMFSECKDVVQLRDKSAHWIATIAVNRLDLIAAQTVANKRKL